jgi:putative ABC transport system substrate-binding protein
MRRRDVIKGITGSAAAWPLAALAQQAAMPVVGFLNTRAAGEDPDALAAFHQGLRDAGYVEGQNVAIESPINVEKQISRPVS